MWPAAPVPEPPPIPAVIIANWVSLVILLSTISDSNAAASPFVGSPPAPRPRAVRPIRTFSSIGDIRSACASVFIA